MKMIDVMVIGGVIAGLAFILMGIPFLTGALLRLLIRRGSAARVAFLAALLVFAAQLPGNVGSGEGPFAHGMSRLLTSKISVGAARTMEFSLWLIVGIGLPFIFATWGAELTDRLRRRKSGPNNTPDGICQPADGLPKPSV